MFWSIVKVKIYQSFTISAYKNLPFIETWNSCEILVTNLEVKGMRLSTFLPTVNLKKKQHNSLYPSRGNR